MSQPEYRHGQSVQNLHSFRGFDGQEKPAGSACQIITVCPDEFAIEVEFPDWTGGHEGSAGDKRKNRWWLTADMIEHVKEAA
jgi:hypothetical protein